MRAGAAADPAALAALWDAYGARVFAFSRRVLGRAGAAADATQDAFLLAQAELGRLARSGESFAVGTGAGLRARPRRAARAGPAGTERTPAGADAA